VVRIYEKYDATSIATQQRNVGKHGPNRRLSKTLERIQVNSFYFSSLDGRLRLVNIEDWEHKTAGEPASAAPWRSE
jgi:hypothetical protein